MLSHWSMCQAATLSTVQHKREILRGVAWDGPTVWSSQPKAEMPRWHKQSPEDVRSLAGPKTLPPDDGLDWSNGKQVKG